MRDKTDVTHLTACELVAALAAGTLSSVEVVEAHIERVEAADAVWDLSRTPGESSGGEAALVASAARSPARWATCPSA